ncbi:MAG: nucleoside 2-deoxyribosyltransferase domain-containing protein [Patescibacteria group bacterium]
MQVVYAHEPLPISITKSIFLAGPTPRSQDVKSWRPEALTILEQLGYDGVVFVPEDGDKKWQGSEYLNQIEWEEYCLNVADCIVFWIPREMATMPALTTNIEWGAWCDSGKVVLGAPPEAEHVGYQKYYASKYQVPTAGTLDETLKLAMTMVGEGAVRTGGEREVPLHIWKMPTFQEWYETQRQFNCRLDGAKIIWTLNEDLESKTDYRFAIMIKLYSTEAELSSNFVIVFRPRFNIMLRT